MKKIFILAVIAILGLSVTSCKCTRTQEVQEEVVEVVDTTAVETPVDSTLTVE